MNKIIDRPILEQYAGVLIVIGLLYLGAFASYLANSGQIEDAVKIGAATNFLLFLFIIPFVYVIMVSVGLVNIGLRDVSKSRNKNFDSAIAFFVGFFSWALVVGITNSFSFLSILQLPLSNVSLAVTGIIPEFWNYFIVTIVAPIAEETIFLSAIPLFIFALLLAVFKEFGLKAKGLFAVLQIVLVVLITAPLFAYFHVGSQALFGFVLSAVVFRSILIVLVWSDIKFNTLSFFDATLMFGIGVHIANNIVSLGGFEKWFGVFFGGLLSGEPVVVIVSLMVFGLFGLPFLFVFNRFFGKKVGRLL